MRVVCQRVHVQITWVIESRKFHHQSFTVAMPWKKHGVTWPRVGWYKKQLPAERFARLPFFSFILFIYDCFFRSNLGIFFSYVRITWADSKFPVDWGKNCTHCIPCNNCNQMREKCALTKNYTYSLNKSQKFMNGLSTSFARFFVCISCIETIAEKTIQCSCRIQEICENGVFFHKNMIKNSGNL